MCCLFIKGLDNYLIKLINCFRFLVGFIVFKGWLWCCNIYVLFLYVDFVVFDILFVIVWFGVMYKLKDWLVEIVVIWMILDVFFVKDKLIMYIFFF